MSHDRIPGEVDPRDVLALDDLLDEDERLARDTVRRFVADRVLPEVGEWFDQGRFPVEMAKEFGALGLLGMHLEGYGCAGVSATQYGLACLELEAGDSGARSFVSVQGSLAMFPIWAFGSEEHKQQWLPGMAAGELIGCFGLTEPDSGSDPVVDAHHGPPGPLRRLGPRRGQDVDHQRLDRRRGRRVGPNRPRRPDGGKVRGFVVPTDTPGFSAPEIHRKVSLRASVTSELVLDGRAAARRGRAARGGGDARAAELSQRGPVRHRLRRRAARPGPATRRRSTTPGSASSSAGPIAGFQLTQRKLVEMMVKVQRGTLVALHLGRMKDAGTLATPQISFGQDGQRGAWRWRSPGRPARCSGPTASPPSTR